MKSVRIKRYCFYLQAGKPAYNFFIIEIKWNGDDFTKDTKTVTGLQNMTVIAIINKVDKKLVVLTANSGIQELELK